MRTRKYLAECITDIDYTDDLVLLANTLNQAKSLLHSLEQIARGISLNVNSDKRELMHYLRLVQLLIRWQASEINRPVHKPLVAISHPLKAMLTYSQENHGLLLTRLSTIWKSDL